MIDLIKFQRYMQDVDEYIEDHGEDPCDCYNRIRVFAEENTCSMEMFHAVMRKACETLKL